MMRSFDRITNMAGRLRELQVRASEPLQLRWKTSGYKKSGLPDSTGWRTFSPNGFWSGKADSHAWFACETVTPAETQTERYELKACTQIGGWAANNPQFIAYINGRTAQGMDTNHTSVPLPAGKNKILLYAYSGMRISEPLRMTARAETIDKPTEAFVYDLTVPFETLWYLDTESPEYAYTLTITKTKNTIRA